MNLHEEVKMLSEMKDYFHEGDTKEITFRIEQLKKLKRIIIENQDRIVDAHREDLGRHEYETYGAEIGTVLSSIAYTVKHLKKWSKKKKVRTPLHQFGAKSYIHPEPYGVVLIIGPYNYPFSLLIEPMIGAIAAGNCIVVKPSEQTPAVTQVVYELLTENFRPDYIRVVEGEKEVTSRLIHSQFDYIFFTGSVPIGKIVMEAASKNLVPVTLELGGKSPCIIDKTANIKVSAERVVWGKFFNTGQTCVAPDYLVIHELIKDAFVKEIENTIRRFYGNDISKSKDYGRIVNERHTDRLISVVLKDNEKVVFGGNYNLKDKYIEPTLIDNVTWEDECMKDEIFGPLLPMMTFNDIDEVIQMINNKPKPLALYIFTKDREIQSRVISETSSGGCCVNDTVSHVASHYLPFGGVGNSGMGAYHGKESFRTFSHMKSILKKSTAIRMSLVFPPYTESKLNMVKKILK